MKDKSINLDENTISKLENFRDTNIDITMQLDSSSYIWNRLIVYNRAYIHVAVGDFDKSHYIPELLPYSIIVPVYQHVRGKTLVGNDISINFMNWLRQHNAYVQITRLLSELPRT